MDWEAKEKERIKAEAIKRSQLMAMNDEEAQALSHVEQYERIRWLREIEAAKWLANLQAGLPPPSLDKPVKRRYYGKTRYEYHKD
jgi:hypothetical protein